MSSENPHARNGSTCDSGVVVHMDMKRHTMSPLRLEIHDLVDLPEFANEDLILRRVRDMLLEDRQKRTES